MDCRGELKPILFCERERREEPDTTKSADEQELNKVLCDLGKNTLSKHF